MCSVLALRGSAAPWLPWVGRERSGRTESVPGARVDFPRVAQTPAAAAFWGATPLVGVGRCDRTTRAPTREEALGLDGIPGAERASVWGEGGSPAARVGACTRWRWVCEAFIQTLGSLGRRQRRCDQSGPRAGNKLCKSPSGDGSDDSLKKRPPRELAVCARGALRFPGAWHPGGSLGLPHPGGTTSHGGFSFFFFCTSAPSACKLAGRAS